MLQCDKLLMRRKAPHRKDFISVFPNNRHGNRKDGLGMCELSPMRLGPVKHAQPGVPDSLTIENYHQFNKVFPNEVDDNRDPKPEFYKMRDEAYQDPVPHRHKYSREILKKICKGNINPLYSIHLWPDGSEHRYDYVSSRYFYCHQYEILAKLQPEYKTLKDLLEEGKNLLILGYDGREITDLYDMYKDPAYPFGHELVLCSLLKFKNPKDYPWNVYHDEHRDLYP